MKTLKKSKMRAGTYDFTYWLVMGDQQQAVNFVNKVHALKEGDIIKVHSARGTVFTHDKYTPILWIPKFPTTSIEYGTLAHEIFHLVRFILQDWTTVTLTEGSEEAWGHLVSKITRDIYGKIGEWQRRKRKPRKKHK